MAVNGERFLKLSSASDFIVSEHALRRIAQYTGRQVSREEAFRLFCRGIYTRAGKLFLMGYRPAYNGRLMKGEKSWYFHMILDGEELIAVIGEGILEGEYVWMTTYGVTRQTKHYRVASFAEISLAAVMN